MAEFLENSDKDGRKRRKAVADAGVDMLLKMVRDQYKNRLVSHMRLLKTISF